MNHLVSYIFRLFHMQFLLSTYHLPLLPLAYPLHLALLLTRCTLLIHILHSCPHCIANSPFYLYTVIQLERDLQRPLLHSVTLLKF